MELHLESCQRAPASGWRGFRRPGISRFSAEFCLIWSWLPFIERDLLPFSVTLFSGLGDFLSTAVCRVRVLLTGLMFGSTRSTDGSSIIDCFSVDWSMFFLASVGLKWPLRVLDTKRESLFRFFWETLRNRGMSSIVQGHFAGVLRFFSTISAITFLIWLTFIRVLNSVSFERRSNAKCGYLKLNVEYGVFGSSKMSKLANSFSSWVLLRTPVTKM